MSDGDKPVGRRFSHVYIERGAPVADSPRARHRIYSYLPKFTGYKKVMEYDELYILLVQEIGLDVRKSLGGFFQNSNIKDILDAVTVIGARLAGRPPRDTPHLCSWRQFVQRVFDEENLYYGLDELCGVHYKPDEEFERNRIATVASLGLPRYAAVLDAFHRARMSLDRSDTTEAIRSVFEATETLVKLMARSKSIARLMPNEIKTIIKPVARNLYGDKTAAGNAASELLDGFSEWVVAAQQYRHAEGSEEPSPPPIEIAVMMVSSGATYLRWLVEMERQLPEP